MTLSVSLTTSCSYPRNAVPTKVVPLPYLPVLLSSPTPTYSLSLSQLTTASPTISSPPVLPLSCFPVLLPILSLSSFFTLPPPSPTLSLPLPNPSSLNPPSTPPSFPLSPPFLRGMFYLCPSDQDQPGEMAALQDQDQQSQRT